MRRRPSSKLRRADAAPHGVKPYRLRIGVITPWNANSRPPTIVFFTDKVRNLHFSDERFLINRLREKFGFRGTPIIIKLKKRH